jgi:translation initiation factor 2-alpha kinase 4
MTYRDLIFEVGIVTKKEITIDANYPIDHPDKALKRLRAIMEGTEYADKLPPIFGRLNAVISYLREFSIKRKVYVNPLSSLNDKFFRGSILFQCVFDTKRRDVFAAGGRYDSLIQEFRPKVISNRSQCHAVGFNLGWEKLCVSMSNYLRGSNKAFLKQGEAEISAAWRIRRVSESRIRKLQF